MGSRVRLTPADIQNTVFPRATIGKRGYDEEQVDSLLDEVTQEMIRLLEQNELLRQRAGMAEAAPVVDDSTELELSAAGAELGRARRARDAAARGASELREKLNQARRAAAERPAVPEQDTGSMLALVQRTADDHLRDAHQQSDSLIVEAREKSANVLNKARTAAEDLEMAARRRYDDSLNNLQSERTQALQDIEGLAHLAEDYQAALHNHMIHQQQLLDGTTTG